MKLYDQLGIDLDEIDRTLCNVLESDTSLSFSASPVREHGLSLVRAGGKRLRPVMAIIGGRFGQPERYPYVLKAAAVLEYIHTASLIHDDIIDQSPLRRGEPTLHTLTGVPRAVLIANYMMARAVEWATETPESDQEPSEQELERISSLASVITELCLGEYSQLRDRFNFDLSIDDYLAKTRNKTALLMAHCLKAGADAANADSAHSELLFQFGEALGMAFQIKDDVLDFAEKKETIGKPAGADLRNGNITLPVLYAMEDRELRREIVALNNESPKEDFDKTIARIASSGAIQRSLKLAQDYTNKAGEAADRLASHPAGVHLIPLMNYFAR
ncbi:polyprenyl synthetase family protein [Paenibacillus sp. CAU 1782]